MDKPAISIFIFGLYLIVEGLLLLLIPNLFLGILGFPLIQDVWPRFLGLGLFIIGYYYIRAAKANVIVFFEWTVGVRIGQFFVLGMFVLLQFVIPIILFFGLIELLSGVWTWITLKD